MKKSEREASEVLKGTARRIVVVRSPDKRIFEEAIFILREDYLRSPGITQSELLKEARDAAHGYVEALRVPAKKRRGRGFLTVFSALVGSGEAYAAIKLFGL